MIDAVAHTSLLYSPAAHKQHKVMQHGGLALQYVQNQGSMAAPEVWPEEAQDTILAAGFIMIVYGRHLMTGCHQTKRFPIASPRTMTPK